MFALFSGGFRVLGLGMEGFGGSGNDREGGDLGFWGFWLVLRLVGVFEDVCGWDGGLWGRESGLFSIDYIVDLVGEVGGGGVGIYSGFLEGGGFVLY